MRMISVDDDDNDDDDVDDVDDVDDDGDYDDDDVDNDDDDGDHDDDEADDDYDFDGDYDYVDAGTNSHQAGPVQQAPGVQGHVGLLDRDHHPPLLPLLHQRQLSRDRRQ